jgi:SAM-dependent methyltransferase
MFSMSAADFYDGLAPYYHLNYGDWRASVDRQGQALAAILQAHGVEPPSRVLDAACGIGTQSLGLARLGYRITGSDLSAGAVVRARAEAEERELRIDFSVADMRSVAEHHGRTFDVVMACDNSIPHLLSDAEILAAFEQFYRCTEPGGLCLISVRDYSQENREGVQVRTPVLHLRDGRRVVLFQVWEFDGPVYSMNLYVVEDQGEAGARTHVFRSRYFAVTLEVLERLMREAGFHAVERLEEVFHQPVLVGRRPVAGSPDPFS